MEKVQYLPKDCAINITEMSRGRSYKIDGMKYMQFDSEFNLISL